MTWVPYCGAGATPADLMSRWNLDPVLLLVLVAGYAGLILHRRAWALPTAALALMLLIFVSPLCALSSALFSARTVHHVLLVAVAAPLLAWSVPIRLPGGLVVSLAAHAAVFWAWHAPAAYGWAMSNDLAYWLMQLSLLGSAVWFWSAVRATAAPAAVAALLVATVQMGLLGALLTFGGRALYEPHFSTTVAWGLAPLQDQQAAGLIMWAPAAAIYLICALVLLGRWIGPSQAVARA